MPPLSVPKGAESAHEDGFTPALVGSKLTLAVIVDVDVAVIEEGSADSETVIAAKVRPALPVTVESLAAVTLIVICTSLGGGFAGAV